MWEQYYTELFFLSEKLIEVGPILHRIVVVEREFNTDKTNNIENCSGEKKN